MKRISLLLLVMLLASCESQTTDIDFETIGSLAEQGDAEAQYLLGMKYDLGEDVVEDDAEALKWYLKSAGQGRADAQHRLGLMYELGLQVAKSDTEAAKWYQLAAEQGHVASKYAMGRMYYSGSGGFPLDPVKAADHFRFAAENGNAKAQHFLGEMYYMGQGVEQSLFYAYVWLSISLTSSDDGLSTRDVIAKSLTAQDIAAAKKRIAVLQEEIEANKISQR